MISRRAAKVTGCVVGAALLVTGGILVSTRQDGTAAAPTTSQLTTTGTATVEKGDLVGTTTRPGTVKRLGGTVIPGGPIGTLTELPAVGTILQPGDGVYRVDNVPVVYLTGTLPQWRPFEDGMADGPDVKQLEENLRAWGYLDQAATAHFDWHTRVALQRWQKATGQPVTGAVSVGAVYFGTGDQVVAERKLEVGAHVEPGVPLLSTTGTERIVTVDLPVGSPLAKVGGAVRVDLPGAAQASGTIRSLGDPTTSDDGKITVAATIELMDPAKAHGLDQVGVSVDFVSESRSGVLSVPASALGAKSGSGFVVEVVGKAGITTRVEVEVGLFAGDRVEITGGKIEAGQKVVVPA